MQPASCFAVLAGGDITAMRKSGRGNKKIKSHFNIQLLDASGRD